MNVQEFFNALLMAVIAVCVPFLASVAASCIRSAADRATEQAKTERQRMLFQEIAMAVETSVTSVAQTYVDNMKDQNLFDADAQRKALNQCIETAMKILSPAAAEFIVSMGDPEEYLRPMVEAEVRRQKQM